MKQKLTPARAGAFRALASMVLLFPFGMVLPADAALRTWTGAGANAFWSAAANWSPAGAPQDGEDLAFPPNAPRRTSTNDLSGRTFGFILFNGAKTDYELHGNGITLSGGLSAIDTGLPAESPQIIFGITLARDLRFVADGAQIGVGRVELAGHTLTLNPTTSNAVVSAGGEISGIGDVVKIGVGEVLYGGPDGNSYQGTTYVSEGTLRLGKGNIGTKLGVPGPLVLGDAQDNLVSSSGRVVLLRSQMIDDASTITIRSGTLDLNGFDESVGELILFNGRITTGTGTLHLLDRVVQSTIFPVGGSSIEGRVSLETNVTFQISSSSHILYLPASVSGPGGITKEGGGTLTLFTSTAVNTFTGPLTVNNGILHLSESPFALDGVPGVTLNGSGVLALEEVSIANKFLAINSSSAAVVLVSPSSTWDGPIQLNFNGTAKINAGDGFGFATFRIPGSIQGTGGIWFGGDTVELLGNNTFTGPVRSACELLLLNTGGGRPFSGPLEVGGTFFTLDTRFDPIQLSLKNPTAEVRWFRDRQNPGQPLTVHSNGFVNLNGRSEDFAGITFYGGRVTAGAGLVTLTGPVVVQAENATANLGANVVLPTLGNQVDFVVSNTLVTVALYLDGIISGSGGITKKGPGLIWIDSTGVYGGPVLIDEGVIHADSATALGSRGAATSVREGGTLSLGSGAGFLGEPLVLAGGGSLGTNGALRSSADIFITNNVVLNGATIIRTEGVNSRIQIQGTISGIGPLTKTGAGVFGFRGNGHNTYSRDTFNTEGTMLLTKPAGFTCVPGHLIIGGGGGLFGASATVRHSASFTITGSVTVDRGGLWDLNGFSESFSVADLEDRPALTLKVGGGVQTGAGTLFLPVGGDVVVNPGTFPGASSHISGHLALDPGPHRFTVQSGVFIFGFDFSELDVPAVISQTSTAADLVKEGPGEIRLGGANSFAGSVTVNEGRLIAAHALALGTTAAGTFVNSNASFALDGGIDVTDETLTLHSTNVAALISLGPVTNEWSGNIVLQRTAGIRVPDARGGLTHSGIATFAVGISGPGGFTKSGPGALLIEGFTGGNGYTGPTTVTDGLLEAVRSGGRSLSSNIVVTGANSVLRTGRTGQIFPARTVLPVGASVAVQGGALWTMNGTNFETLSRLVGDGRLAVSTGGALTVSNDVSCTFSGLLSGTGALNKRGPATFQLTGNSYSYTGLVTVFDGTCKVDGDIPSSPATVKPAAILRGGGTLGDVTVEPAGVVKVDARWSGVSGGALGMNSVNFQPSGGVLSLDFFGPDPTGGNDELYVNGSVTLGNLNLSAGFLYPPREGDVVTLITKAVAGAVSGIISGFPEGSVQMMGSVPVVTSYVGGDGNDVTLTVTNLPLRAGGSQFISSSSGNVLVPDDCSQIRLVVTNRSVAPVTNLRGTLRSLTEGVVVTIAESAYPNLAPNARGTNATPFQIRTEPGFSCGAGAEFELVLTASNAPPIAILYTMVGTPGYSLQFDGRDGRVDVPANTFSGVVNNFTIELWANPTGNRNVSPETNAGISVLLSRPNQRFAVFPDRGDLAYGANHVSAGLSIGRNGISVFEHGTNRLSGAIHLPSRLVYSNAVSGWTHVALVYASRRPQLYVNGALVRSGAASIFSSVHPSGSLGGSTQGDLGNFEGQLDEVRIWNVALDPSQIQANLTRRLAGNEPNLVTYFRADEGAGLLLTDSAPASPNPSGTLMNGVTFVLADSAPITPPDADCLLRGGACESCFVATGMFTTNTPTMTELLSATGSPSLCFPTRACPGPFDIPDLPPTRYLPHTFTNTGSSDACVTAQLHFDCPAAPHEAMHVAAYLGTFDPGSVCLNYLGDPGGDSTVPFSFRVPARTNVVLVVSLRVGDIGCDTYTLELFGLPCPPPTLRIAMDTVPDKVVLQWSSAYPDYQLQSVNALDGSGLFGFGNVVTPPVLAGGKFAVTNGITPPRQFFRLEAR